MSPQIPPLSKCTTARFALVRLLLDVRTLVSFEVFRGLEASAAAAALKTPLSHVCQLVVF